MENNFISGLQKGVFMGYTGTICSEINLFKTNDPAVSKAIFEASLPFCFKNNLINYNLVLARTEQDIRKGGYLDACFNTALAEENYFNLTNGLFPKETMDLVNKYVFGMGWNFPGFGIKLYSGLKATSLRFSRDISEFKHEGRTIIDAGKRFLRVNGSELKEEDLMEYKELGFKDIDSYLAHSLYVNEKIHDEAVRIYTVILRYLSVYKTCRVFYDTKQSSLIVLFPDGKRTKTETSPDVADLFFISHEGGYSGMRGSVFGVSFVLRKKADMEKFHQMYPQFSGGEWWKNLDDNLDGFEFLLSAGY